MRISLQDWRIRITHHSPTQMIHCSCPMVQPSTTHPPGHPPAHPPAVHHKHGPELVLKVLVLLAVDAHGGEAQGAAQDGVGLGASAAAVGASKSSAGKEY